MMCWCFILTLGVVVSGIWLFFLELANDDLRDEIRRTQDSWDYVQGRWDRIEARQTCIEEILKATQKRKARR